MAGYRTFNPSFWDDDFILDLSKDEKYFYFYLITNPKTTLWGIYEISFKVINFQTGLSIDMIKKLIIKLQDKRKIIFDESTNEICIRNYLRHNFNSSPLVIKSIVSGFKGIKNQNLIQYLNGIDTLSIPYTYPIDTPCIPTVIVIDTVTNTVNDSFKVLNKDLDTKKDTKQSYGEYKKVLLTEKQFNKLHNDYVNADELIKFFDEYMEEKPSYKSDNHNLAIRRWVVDAVNERNAKKKNGNGNGIVKPSLEEEMIARVERARKNMGVQA